jgi:hypothetical protein
MPTAQASQYISRITSLTSGRDPIEILSSTPEALRKVARGIDAQRLQTRFGENKWSPAEIMAHLADSELMAGVRFRQTLAGPNGTPIPAYDQNAWASVCQYGEIPFEDSLRTFKTVRDCNLRLLRRLNSADKEKYGVHQERGRESVADLITMMAGHDLNHLHQVSAALRS